MSDTPACTRRIVRPAMAGSASGVLSFRDPLPLHDFFILLDDHFAVSMSRVRTATAVIHHVDAHTGCSCGVI